MEEGFIGTSLVVKPVDRPIPAQFEPSFLSPKSSDQRIKVQPHIPFVAQNLNNDPCANIVHVLMCYQQVCSFGFILIRLQIINY